MSDKPKTVSTMSVSIKDMFGFRTRFAIGRRVEKELESDTGKGLCQG